MNRVIRISDSIAQLFKAQSDVRNLRYKINSLTEQDRQLITDVTDDQFTLNKLYWLWHYSGQSNEIVWPICKTCGKPLHPSSTTRDGIRKYCSRHCAAVNEDRQHAAKQTWIENYGVDINSQLVQTTEPLESW